MKTKGARKVLDRLYELLERDDVLAERARKIGQEGHKLAIYNPPLAKKVFEELDRIEAERSAIRADLRATILSRVEPYMERAAPKVEQRLAELERRLDEIEARGTNEGEPQLRLAYNKRGTGG